MCKAQEVTQSLGLWRKWTWFCVWGGRSQEKLERWVAAKALYSFEHLLKNLGTIQQRTTEKLEVGDYYDLHCRKPNLENGLEWAKSRGWQLSAWIRGSEWPVGKEGGWTEEILEAQHWVKGEEWVSGVSHQTEGIEKVRGDWKCLGYTVKSAWEGAWMGIQWVARCVCQELRWKGLERCGLGESSAQRLDEAVGWMGLLGEWTKKTKDPIPRKARAQ